MVQQKKQVRAEALALRNALGEQARVAKSALIAKRLISTDFFKKVGCIFIFVSVRSEVHTGAIMQTALALGKTVCVPLIDMKNKAMIACAVTDPARDLHPGIMGIPEPDRSTCAPVPACEIDCAIVPGLAFTVQGHRIGYGGGFYDRFLREWPGNGCALAFEEQIVKSLPFDPDHDAAVGRIITEQRDIPCGS
jgi:5-formyltetrahydrofolate cyclo-ligase